MLVAALNLIYREFLKRALSGILVQGGRLWWKSWRQCSSSSALAYSWPTHLMPTGCG